MINYTTFLFDLEDDNIKIIDQYEEGSTKIIVIEKPLEEHFCPKCGFKMHSKGVKARTVRHPILQDGYNLEIKIRQRRWKCTNLDCNYDVSDSFNFVSKNRRTTNIIEFQILESFRDLNNTAKDIAKKFNVSTAFVLNVFEKYVHQKRYSLPEIVSVDEVYLDMNNHCKYGLVIFDFYSGEPIDILSSRQERDTAPYFRSIPLEERNRVKYLLSDMYKPYLNYVNKYFKNAIPIVDSFHVMKWLLDKIDHMCVELKKYYKKRDEEKATKIAIAKGQDLFNLKIPQSDEVYLLTHHRWVILKNQWNIQYGKPSKFDHHFNRKLNAYQYESLFLDVHKDFSRIRELKEQYVIFNKYTRGDFEEVEIELDKLIYTYEDCTIEIFNNFARLLREYKEPIINSFTYTKRIIDGEERESRLSNGPIESFNRKIKDLIRNTRGFMNFENLRNRILFATRKSAPLDGTNK